MSKYEGRLVLNNFSKQLYKLYNAQKIFCATRRLRSRRARAGKVARGQERLRARTKRPRSKSAASATANEPFQIEMDSNTISSLFII
ncbi:BQ5605_C002g01642 [Microbotryum silenes-dioicae]|uniref:BQ5605_C002g01642 protein n=1 Tax=Microbotryum silenes-dioicae TaxID=796604 RepID=A0A2X0M321_9BASI|nr:BQ5605_C002g01642 [Microbotryum silenes-dioicae]